MRLFPLISVAMRVAVVAQPSMHDSFDDDNFWGDSSDSSSSMLNFEASPTESMKEKSKAGKTGYPGLDSRFIMEIFFQWKTECSIY